MLMLGGALSYFQVRLSNTPPAWRFFTPFFFKLLPDFFPKLYLAISPLWNQSILLYQLVNTLVPSIDLLSSFTFDFGKLPMDLPQFLKRDVACSDFESYPVESRQIGKQRICRVPKHTVPRDCRFRTQQDPPHDAQRIKGCLLGKLPNHSG